MLLCNTAIKGTCRIAVKKGGQLTAGFHCGCNGDNALIMLGKLHQCTGHDLTPAFMSRRKLRQGFSGFRVKLADTVPFSFLILFRIAIALAFFRDDMDNDRSLVLPGNFQHLDQHL